MKNAFAAETIIREVPVLDIMVSNPPNSVNWTITANGADGGSCSVAEYPSQALGDLAAYSNIADVTGNGTVNEGDFFMITASGGSLTPASQYRVTLVYSPTGDVMISKRFNA
ncbi:MAG: hypothetical protein ACUVT7_06730 [Thermoplasmata archaeon]